MQPVRPTIPETTFQQINRTVDQGIITRGGLQVLPESYDQTSERPAPPTEAPHCSSVT